jgi:hypothetical protein
MNLGAHRANAILGTAAAVLLVLVLGGAWSVAAQFARRELEWLAFAVAAGAAFASLWLPFAERAWRAAAAALLSALGIVYAQLLGAGAAVAGTLGVSFGEAISGIGPALALELILARNGAIALAFYAASVLAAAAGAWRLAGDRSRR